MKPIKTDLRIVKTKKNIYEALFRLMEDYTFEEIKVSQICEEAMINRSTFYAHFDDKYALLDALIKDLKDRLKDELDKNSNITNSKEYYMELIKLLLNHFESQKDIYFPLLLKNRNSIAMDMIYDTIEENISKKVESEGLYNDQIPISFICHFYLGAIFNIGMNWIHSNCQYSKEEIIKYLSCLIPDDPLNGNNI